MASSNPMAAEALRMSGRDLKSRLDAGEAITILDARQSKAWNESYEKIRGAFWVDPEHFQVDPRWPRDQLTVVY
jgi:hypothetical protein